MEPVNMQERELINYSYVIKLWLISVGVVSPIFLGMFTISNNSGDFRLNDSLGVIVLFIFFGLFFSIPTLLLCLAVFWGLRKTRISNLYLKLVLDLISILGIYVTFYFIDMGAMMNAYFLIYAVSVVISSIIIPLRSRV